jgi:hypothetical protein
VPPLLRGRASGSAFLGGRLQGGLAQLSQFVPIGDTRARGSIAPAAPGRRSRSHGVREERRGYARRGSFGEKHPNPLGEIPQVERHIPRNECSSGSNPRKCREVETSSI